MCINEFHKCIMEASRLEDEAEQQRDTIRELKSINHKQEKRVRHYGSEALRQTAFYLFIQPLLLLSVSGVPCHFWWIPFCLSLLLSILFALTFTSTIASYVRIQLELDFNVLELEVVRERISLAESGYSGGGNESRVIKADKFRVYKLYAYVYSMLLALLAFTVIMLYACRYVPCA